MAGFLHDLRARVEILIDPMAEAHQLGVAILVLHFADEGRNILGMPDLGEHLQHGLIGATMRRAPKGRDTCRDAGEGVRAS